MFKRWITMHLVPRARSQIVNRYVPGTKYCARGTNRYAPGTKGEAPCSKEKRAVGDAPGTWPALFYQLVK